MLANRYDVDPDRLRGQKSIIDYVQEAGKRLRDLETSLQAGNTAIEDGNFTVRNGDIIVSETDGSIVLRIMHGIIPEIRMWPLGEVDTHRIALIGFEEATAGQSVSLMVEKHPSADIDGGKLLLTKQYAILSHQPDGAQESFLWLNAGWDFLYPEVAVMRCRWTDQLQFDSHTGLYMGAFTASSGFTTWTHTYFTPFATTMAPLFTVGVTGATLQWGIESYSTSAFVLRFSTTSGNKLVTFWNFRL